MARKWYSLIDKIWSYENLAAAWKKVASNKGAAGIDQISCDMFVANLEENLASIQAALKSGEYQPQPVRRHYVPKDDGRLRPLGIPAVMDRVVQQAILNVLGPIFEAEFEPNSYGFRAGRNSWQAASHIKQLLEQGYHWVVDADIRAYFDTIDQVILLDLIARRIADGSVLKLIKKILRAGVMEGGKLTESLVGTPQGGPLSPLLANIYLHELDTVMRAARFHLVRYADDFVILTRSREDAEKSLEMVKLVMIKLNLELHPDKTRIVNYHQEVFDFLGFTFCYTAKSKKGYVFPRAKAIAKFMDKIRKGTARTLPINVQMIIDGINPIIRGWGNYFAASNAGQFFERLDRWIRERLRAFIMKRWAHSRETYEKLTNKYFADLGLVSLSELRRKAMVKCVTL